MLVAAVGAGLLLGVVALVGVGGWPGEVSGCVAAGERSCEAFGTGLLIQPSNTATSLFLVIAGLAVIWIGSSGMMAMDGSRMRTVHAYVLGGALVLSGVGSASFHASITEWGGWADLLGASAVLIFAIVYLRTANYRGGIFVGRYVLVLAAAGLSLLLVGNERGIWLLGGLGALAVLAEVSAAIQRRGRRTVEWRWLGIAAATYAVGTVVWWFSRDGYSLCDPSAAWQWHGAWHLLAAVAVLFVFMYWRSERRLTARS
jgi:hypothetical protein